MLSRIKRELTERTSSYPALLQELEPLGWTACRNVEIDVRLGYATTAVKNNWLRPEPPLFSSSAICYVILRPG